MRPTAGAAAWRGIRRRCPRCGTGRVFTGWFAMHERCGSCGMRYERREGTSLGSMSLNTIVTFLAIAASVAIALIVGWPDISVAAVIAVGLVTAVAVPVLFYPWSMTLWLAFEIVVHPLDPDEEADALAHAGATT